MRDMWELPKPSLASRAVRVVIALAVVWAVVAVPLTVMLAHRVTPPPAPPATRPLNVMEEATVRYAAQSLSTSPVTLTFTVTSPSAELHVTQSTDAARNVSYGTVVSQGQNAELAVNGDTVLMHGSPQFWASVGVPTSEPGWIDVGDRLGDVPFPVISVISKLDPSGSPYVDNPAPGADKMTFHRGGLTMMFTEAGPAELILDNRSAKVVPTPADARARLDAAAATPPSPLKLIGATGSLTVAGPPLPPKP